MEIATGFELSRPLEEAWPVLSDLERVAPCMPGVKVESVDDDGLHATMRVKVGPVTVSYKTLIAIESLDEDAKTAVLRASGREARGSGTVAATVTAVLGGNGESTSVDLTTDLAVTGKVAQFGGGVMTEVADRLLKQFATRLEADLASPAAASPPAAGGAGANGSASVADAASASPGTAPGAGGATARPGGKAAPSQTPPPEEPEPADVGSIAGRVLAPRLALAAAIALLLLLLLRRRP